MKGLLRMCLYQLSLSLSITINFTNSASPKKYEVGTNFTIFMNQQNSCFMNSHFEVPLQLKENYSLCHRLKKLLVLFHFPTFARLWGTHIREPLLRRCHVPHRDCHRHASRPPLRLWWPCSLRRCPLIDIGVSCVKEVEPFDPELALIWLTHHSTCHQQVGCGRGQAMSSSARRRSLSGPKEVADFRDHDVLSGRDPVEV
jgi:hypothetical protein